MFKFNSEVSLGHVLQVIVIGAGVLIWGLRLEGRVQMSDLKTEVQKERLDGLELLLDKRFDELKLELRDNATDLKNLIARIPLNPSGWSRSQ